jgi:hypothetical protein
MIEWKKAAVVALSAISVSLFMPVGVEAAPLNLVYNGNFEINGGVGELGYIVGSPPHQHYLTTLAGWTTPDYSHSFAPDSNSFNFVFSPSTVDSTDPHLQAQGAFTRVALWGPDNGSNNGLTHIDPTYGETSSPVGDGNGLSGTQFTNYFVGLNGDYISSSGLAAGYHVGPLQQTIGSGLIAGGALVVGDTYQLSFDWAASQQTPFAGATVQFLEVSLGGQTQNTTPVNLPSHGFSGWMNTKMTFTATSPSEVLSFLAHGDKPVPPFLLLDGVSLYDTTTGVNPGGSTPTPEPSSLVASLLAMGIFGAVWIGTRVKQRATRA